MAEGEVPARLGAPIAVEVPLRAVHLFDAADGRALFHGAGAVS
ncbi:MAG: hypothetical protein R3C69_04540 [Geminicoccaceae bacterium]